jgi:hypothetical protein
VRPHSLGNPSLLVSFLLLLLPAGLAAQSAQERRSFLYSRSPSASPEGETTQLPANQMSRESPGVTLAEVRH